jgi:hypothetical protein
VERPNANGAQDAIDAVVAWVDGRDPKHRAKRNRYLADPGDNGAPERVASKERRFSSNHVIYPLLRPPMEELFEMFEPAFFANAVYRFRDRRQLWTISAHDHLLLKSKRARVVKSHSSAHFSVRYCLSASPDALEARLKSLADGSVRMACINHLEAVVGKVPDATRYLSEATGPAAPFERGSLVQKQMGWAPSPAVSRLVEHIVDRGRDGCLAPSGRYHCAANFPRCDPY